jgi:hypothetical protein
VSRLSRAAWRCIPQRLVFRPDNTLTRFGRWAFRRTLRKMPRGEFITTSQRTTP